MKRSTTPFGIAAACAVALAGLTLAAPRPALADPSGPFTWTDATPVADAGWGRMIPLGGPDWACVDNLYPSAGAEWQIEISHDGARTWRPIATVAEPGRQCDNGNLLRLPGGALLLTGRSVIDDRAPGKRVSYHLPVYRSDDRGRTWRFVSQVDASDPPPWVAGQPSVGLWEPYLFLLADGRVACAYANEKHSVETPAYSQVVSERVSGDGGKTWGPESMLAAQIGGGGQRPGMPVVTRMANHRYGAIFEVVGVGNADAYFKTSPDGVHWPPGIGAGVPCQHSGPWVASLADGRLVASSSQNALSYSSDYGASWELATPAPWPLGFVFSWPAIYETAPGRLAVMKTQGGVAIRWGVVSPRRPAPRSAAYDFASGTDAGWTEYGGRYAVVGGAYVASNAGTAGKSLAGSAAWRDGVLQADVRLDSPGDAGLMIRTTNADFSGPDAAYGYYVGLDSGGSIFLSRNADDYTELARAPLAVGLDAWHRITVVARGAALSVYADGGARPLLRVSDSYLTHGQIGVRAHLCDAEFKAVSYSGLDTPPAKPMPGRTPGARLASAGER